MHELPLVRAVIEWVTAFIVEFAAPWIISRGGWVRFELFFRILIIFDRF